MSQNPLHYTALNTHAAMPRPTQSSTLRDSGSGSDVTKVGVTRCGKWWCHFLYLKSDDYFL